MARNRGRFTLAGPGPDVGGRPFRPSHGHLSRTRCPPAAVHPGLGATRAPLGSRPAARRGPMRHGVRSAACSSGCPTRRALALPIERPSLERARSPARGDLSGRARGASPACPASPTSPRSRRANLGSGATRGCRSTPALRRERRTPRLQPPTRGRAARPPRDRRASRGSRREVGRGLRPPSESRCRAMRRWRRRWRREHRLSGPPAPRARSCQPPIERCSPASRGPPVANRVESEAP